MTGHGISGREQSWSSSPASFFAEPDEDEGSAGRCAGGGRSWRGWFGVGGELTSGVPDRKEGLYFGAEHGPDRSPRSQAGTPLHGANLFPAASGAPPCSGWIDGA